MTQEEKVLNYLRLHGRSTFGEMARTLCPILRGVLYAPLFRLEAKGEIATELLPGASPLHRVYWIPDR